MKRRAVLSIVIICIIASDRALADQVIYVDAGALGSNDGSSWQDAYTYLQDALKQAESAAKPLEVWVAEGTYTPDRSTTRPNGTGFRHTSFVLVSGVRLFGGFPAGGGTWQDKDPDTHTTILSGDLSGNDSPKIALDNLLDDPSRRDNCYNVVVISNTDQQTILYGFTITGGNARDYPGETNGGGILGDPLGNAEVHDCTIVGNAARGNGGGLYQCHGLINNCAISGNMARYDGGGLYDCDGPISDCTINGNSCTIGGNVANRGDGGGLYDCDGPVTDCAINGNMAGDCGGGLFECSGPISNCTISGNVAENYGGGLCRCDGSISDCTITGNTSYDKGSGGLYLCNAPITRCTISNNQGTGLTECDGPITDCTISENTGTGVNGCNGAITNCLVSHNADNGLRRCNGSISDCTITNNGGSGLDDCDGSIRNCIISDNADRGLRHCDGSVSHCTISHNTGNRDGGGFSYCECSISYCIITGNTARLGGAIFHGDGPITHCVISGNKALDSVGGLYYCSAPITHCTIVGNKGQGGPIGRSDGPIVNCIIWANQPDIYSLLYECDTPIFSCVPAGVSGPGCINADPEFLVPGYWDPNGTPQDADDDFWVEGDYRLREGSPCIDAGNLLYTTQLPAADADGNTRLAGPQIDMGCFEFGALPDTDGDWLADMSEPAHAENPDRDDDGILDGIELLRGTDPDINDPLVQWNVPADVTSIQQALFFSRSGETITIAEGTYYENLLFPGHNITFTGADPNDPATVAATIISGDTDRDPLTNSGRVMSLAGKEDETCQIRGLTITAGHTGRAGGGIHGHGSHATIRNCTISGNTAFSGAGLVYCDGTIANCTISGNHASHLGGGLSNCNGSIRNCTIIANIAQTDGGALNRCRGSITNCIMWANIQGGDFPLAHSPSPLFSCVQGGWPKSTITETDLSPDDPNGDPRHVPNVKTSSLGYTQDVPATGSINLYSDPCFVDPGRWVDANDPNMLVDPSDPNALWVDGDYHLKSQAWRWDLHSSRWTYDSVTSPCIDAGDPAAPLGEEPLTIPEDPDNTHGRNLRINMGVYGGTAQASIPPHDWAIRADYSNDGTVNITDFACWSYGLPPGTLLSPDLNRNGIADPDDLSILSEDWLKQTTWFSDPSPMEPLPFPATQGGGGTAR